MADSDPPEEGNLQSSPLTKDEVNTVIVSLRPAVAQARVHIIHQHARHVKNLKLKKCSSDKQKEQNDRKIKRYVQEIELLKKSSRDSISRYVLITKKSFIDVVKKESKTQKYNMKVRSYVRVSEHAAVAKIVKALREKHRDWELVLPRIVQKLGKKKKKLTQEENAEETNSIKQEIVKNNVEESDEEIEEGSDSEDEMNSKTDVESVGERERQVERHSDSVQELDSGSDKSDVETDEENEDGSDEKKVVSHSDSVQELEQDSVSDKSNVESDEEYDDGSDEDGNDDDFNEVSDEELNSDENSFVSSLKEALGKTEKQSSIVKVSKKGKNQEVDGDGESVVKMLDLKSRNAKKELMQTQEKTDNSYNKAGAQKRSSFFLGGESDDDEDFEQSDVESNEDGHGEGTHQRNGVVENKNFRPKFDKRIEKRGSDSHNQKRDPNFGGKRKQFQKSTSVKKPKFNKGPDRPFSALAEDRNPNKNVVKKDIKVKPNDNNKIVDVHPSWEAKQKQKPSIQTFQGKKTVFE